MLGKYPAVTIVGGLAMALGVGLGAAYLEVTDDILHPSLPLDEGERIVGLQNWDVAANKPELRSAKDFMRWRGQLRSVDSLGAFRSIEKNLGRVGAPGEPALGASITPSALQMAKPRILQGIVEARQGSSSVGIRATADASPLIVDVVARAADGNTNRGIEVLGSADVTIRRSTMSGSDAGLYSDSNLTVFVTQSTLRQGTGGTGTLDCVATDDGAGSRLSAICT